ncbi:hypothetical protein FKM82_001242 [Ascaphus truei]
MAEDSPKSTAAEIPVTSNGEIDDTAEHNFNLDLKRSIPAGLGLSETQITSHGFDSSKEGIIEAGPFQAERQRAQLRSGTIVLAEEPRNTAIEKFELVRRWSLNTYKCTRQILSERLGRGSRTVDLELESQIEILRDNKKKYEYILKLAQTLSSQLYQMVQTQRQLGDAFADLSLKSLELHEEFGYNADTQKLLAKNGETLLGAINFFIASVNTLVNKTIEDTLVTVKLYETASSNRHSKACSCSWNINHSTVPDRPAAHLMSLRWGVLLLWPLWSHFSSAAVPPQPPCAPSCWPPASVTRLSKVKTGTHHKKIEYDAYRTDLEELNMGPRDAITMPKIEQSQQLFQAHKEKYDKMRSDVAVKLKFLEENKVKVLHNQLVLFHNAIAAYFAGNQKQLEQTLKQFHVKLKAPGMDAPSWLEEQ